MPMHINLPSTPIDGFEVRYFTTRYDRVEEILLKYHVNSKWGDVCKERGGADFIDQWQVFVDGRFSGRMQYWAAPGIRKDWAHEFETRGEAVSALKNALEVRALQADEKARECREQAARIA